jgi:3-deoxy-D-manno-octulosonic-acid transferase
MSWLLDLAYLLTVLALSPLLGWRMLAHGKYRAGWSEKLLGRVPPRSSKSPCVWLHAVSVGEVVQLGPVLAGLRQRLPHVEFVITTTTPTGLAVARDKYPSERVCFCPLDFSWAVREAFRRLRPDALVLVELEIWPNLVRQARRQGVPLALVNGRVSETSSRGYRRIRPLMSRWLSCFEVLAAQNQAYASRLISLGAPAGRVCVTGSIKFDGVNTDRDNPRTDELRRAFGLGASEIVFIAGSTQDPEESLALETYRALRPRFPNLRLMIVPRHKERFDEVAGLIERRGYPLVRRSGTRSAIASSAPAARSDEPPVLLLDTLGELSWCWGLADVAFVGGSLTSRGGQNMIEPAGYGAALLFGPHTHNFRDVVDMLLAEEAAQVVHSGPELTAAVAACLADRESAQARGLRAQRLVLSQRGAASRTVDLIATLSCFGGRSAKAA